MKVCQWFFPSIFNNTFFFASFNFIRFTFDFVPRNFVILHISWLTSSLVIQFRTFSNQFHYFASNFVKSSFRVVTRSTDICYALSLYFYPKLALCMTVFLQQRRSMHIHLNYHFHKYSIVKFISLYHILHFGHALIVPTYV